MSVPHGVRGTHSFLDAVSRVIFGPNDTYGHMAMDRMFDCMMFIRLSALWIMNGMATKQGIFDSLFLQLATQVMSFAAAIYTLRSVA